MGDTPCTSVILVLEKETLHCPRGIHPARPAFPIWGLSLLCPLVLCSSGPQDTFFRFFQIQDQSQCCPLSSEALICRSTTLQRQNTEILEQIFPEKEYRGLSPNFHIHVSVNDLYIPTTGLPILLEEICRLILGLYKSLTDT